MEPYKEESLVTVYAALIAENKEKRKLRGEWRQDEPAELLFDSECGDGSFVDDNGVTQYYPWQFTNLISAICVQDIFGDDYNSVCRLLDVHPAREYVFKDDDNYENILYYREQDIIRAIEILRTLAKSNFVNTLRPTYHYVKDDEPVYSGRDLMNLLDIKEERLRKFREDGYLGYTKYSGSDKIWYLKKDVEKFLNNPIARHEPI